MDETPDASGTVGVEIERMRATGRADAETASLLSAATDLPGSEEDLCRSCAGLQARRRG